MKLRNDNRPANAILQDAKPQRRGPPNYFTRREQVRLFLLCSMLMLVLVLMNEARKPANWDWLWAGQASTLQTPPAKPIDTRIDQADQVLPIDGFTAELPNADITPPNTANYLPEISPQLLSTIKDNTVMRAAENDAWMTMLVALQSRTIQQINSLSRGNVGFAQLFRQTDFYRGQLVTVSGTARRLESITPRENEHGIEQLYRWIVQPKGGDAPIVIYSLEKPAQLAVSQDIREPCSFTGFCFKRWAYPAGDGTRVAPLLLAKTPEWRPPEPRVNTPIPSGITIATCMLVLLSIAAAIAFSVYRSANVKRPDIDRLRAAEADLETNLQREAVLPGTAEALRALAESAEAQDS